MKPPFYIPNRHEELAAKLGFKITPDGLLVTSPDGKTMKQHIGGRGYKVFAFGPKSKRHKCLIHRFNAWFKFGDKIYEPNIVCRHLDGNPHNNHQNNIELGTQSDNMMDRPADARHKHAFAASRNSMKHDHLAIVDFYRVHGFNKTMVEFGISSKGTLSFIINKTQTASPVPFGERPRRRKSPSN